MGTTIPNYVALTSIVVLSTLNIQQMVNCINTILVIISFFFHSSNVKEKNHLSLNAFRVLTLIWFSSFSFSFFLCEGHMLIIPGIISCTPGF